MTKQIKNKGFTLIEMVIYLGITGFLAVSIISFVSAISGSKVKTYVIQEVHSNSKMALDLISKKIHSADSVNLGASVFGINPGELSLAMDNPAENPTIIKVNNGSLEITEGVSAPIRVTSNEVNIANLIFADLSGGNNRENIGIAITISYNNPPDIKYTYSQDLRTSVNVRQ
jgi:type II secretory pathway pseudopilin PulG